MAAAPNPPEAHNSRLEVATRIRRSGRWRWVLAFFLLVILVGVVCMRYAASHAAPILRARVIDTLSARFKSKVELQGIDVSVANGLAVHGTGLKIFGATDPNPSEPGIQPLIYVQEFRFQTGIRTLFRSPMHVHTVQVAGMVLNLPPREDRAQLSNIGQFSKKKMSIIVDELICENTQLIINTRKPGKSPLDFQIDSLKMKDVGQGQPMHFDATLVNPKPVGNIQSEGMFGPFRETEPRETPVEGDYAFTHADLGTLKGISGILASTGKYGGTLGRIEVAGATETPDFRIKTGQAVNLHTDFHAIVDGTDGDTYLQPVTARFLNSAFTAEGKVIRVQNPHGHDIELNVVLDHARIEDLLRLGVKTDPPVMSGPITMTARMSLQPGPADMTDRLKLDGNFKITGGQFSNDKIQDRIDSLSLRAQGKPKLAQEHADVNVSSEMSGTFRLDQGLFAFSKLHFSVPGAQSDVLGQYSLDGNTFDFHGKLRLDAKLSQMTTGWKSILLKPVDPFFKKNGAGTEIPFKVTGTRSEPHFGLDLGHQKNEADEKPTEATPKSNLR
jgi:AsmA-like C-terminal region